MATDRLNEFLRENAGPSANGDQRKASDRPPAVKIIFDHMQSVYRPAFRRGDRIWSAALRTEVRRGQALAGASDSELMQALADCAEESKGSKAKRKQKAVRLYKDYAPVAWADLLRQVPDEPEAAEIDQGAEQDFRRRLSAALTRLVTLSCGAGRHGSPENDTEDQRQARSILEWCWKFAKPGPWKSVRSYYVWSRWAGTGADKSFRVAIRPELMAQLGLRDLAQLGQDRLADLCERYGVGRRCRAGRGGQRAIELDPDWLLELLEGPGPTEGDSQGGSGHAGAQARESAVSPSPKEKPHDP
jgi:hypothetical protein